jgi:aminoglycoside phosphotransferase (APT) family kinase protein
MSRATLELLGDHGDQRLEASLAELEVESQALFQPECWISGDPNPLNWGLRDDGSLALFDWELFGPGVPAIDLAVAIPGLGDAHAFVSMAEAYREIRTGFTGAGDTLPPSDELARRIALAKAASVVQLCYACFDGIAQVRPDLIDWLRRSFPAWVATAASSL